MGKIRISVRCSTGAKFDAEIDEAVSVLELKRKLADEAKVPPPQQRLIYKGRVLKDELPVEHYNILHGDAVHLVASAAPAGGPDTAGTAAAAGASPGASAEARSAAAGIPTPNMAAAAGPAGMPPGLSAMMDSPIVQSMLNNPELMRTMMMANPQVRAMVEQNPQLGQILSDPELLRTTMNAARNPALMNELMRNQDRAIANIESLPGGYNALARMYEDVAPMMDASMSASNGGGQSSSASGTNDTAGNDEGSAGAPIPNPWSSNSNGGNAGSAGSSAPGLGAAGGMMPNFFGGGGSGGAGGFPFGGGFGAGSGNAQQGSQGFSLPPIPPEFMQQVMQTMAGARGQQAQPQPAQQSQGVSGSAGAAASNARAASLRRAPNPWAPADAADSPQTVYKEQLAQMESMGFPDTKANIQALLRCDGNVDQAVERLLEDMS